MAYIGWPHERYSNWCAIGIMPVQEDTSDLWEKMYYGPEVNFTRKEYYDEIPRYLRFSSWHHRPKVFKHYNQDRWPWLKWQILYRNTFTTSDFAVDAGMGSAHKTYMSVSLSHQWTTEQVITFLSINFRSNFSQKKIGMGWLDPGGVRKRAP